MMATAYIQEALESARRSRQCEIKGSFQRLESLLARGRLLTVLSDSEEEQAQGRADLEELISITTPTDGSKREELHPGTRAILRINAAFYLAMSCEEVDDYKRAEELFSEVVALDPLSAFGKVAYERLDSGNKPS